MRFRLFLMDGLLISAAVLGASRMVRAEPPALPTDALAIRSMDPQRAVGTVTGQVTDAATQQPIAGAMIVVEGTSLGAVASADGRYRIANVPAGTHTVIARRIGYAPGRQPVTVAADQQVTMNFALTQAVSQLDQVVVTGTAGQARQREVGNSIAQINIATDRPPMVNAEQALQGQAAGITIMETGGQVGSGRQIRLRGSTSIAMSNQPLLYVDGVRIRSDMLPPNMESASASGPGAMIQGSGSGSGTVASPLNDIDPSDIERIEVIKGAAATTLYGTEAASGVIQIFTKRGTSGAASWTASTDQGVSQMWQRFGTKDKPLLGFDPFLQNGISQVYSASVAASMKDMGYYFSTSYNNNTGIFPTDWERSLNVRGNLNFRPTTKLAMDWNTSIIGRDVENVPMGNNAEGLSLNVIRGSTNYIGSDKPEDIRRLFEQEWTTGTDHVVTGLTVRHQTTDDFTNRVTLGYDKIAAEFIGYFPYGFLTRPLGYRSNRRWSSSTMTFDYVAALQTRLPKDLTGRFSAGAQSVTSETSSNWGTSQNFPGPGDQTLSNGAIQQTLEDRIRVINAGVFGEALFGMKERYFLTLGMRADGNSAFGKGLGLQLYPKASMSWVLSDESFFPERFGTWKLRAAYGFAGRAPGAFDAVRTWSPSSFAGQVAFEPNSVGNKDLGPERTAEAEFGFDATLLDQRITIGFSYYNTTTNDALLRVSQMPSMGFSSSQLVNVGVIKNTGQELTVNGNVIDRQNFAWDLGFNVSHNENKLTSLGGAAGFILGATGWVLEGYPAPVMVGTKLMNPDAIADPILVTNTKFGPSNPPTNVGINTKFTFHRVELSALVNYLGGNYVYDRASRNMASRRVWPVCQDGGANSGYAMLADGRRAQMNAFMRVGCDSRATPRDFMIFKADFVKLRHVTLLVPLPKRFLGNVRTASLSASLRNIRLWHDPDLRIFDAEMGGQNGAASPVREIVENIPAPQSLTLSLRLAF